MTDAIGSTESGMNGIRFVTKGDAPKEGITTVQASADSVVLDDNLKPVEPGSGVVGRVARGGNIPIGYYNDPEKTAQTFVTDADGNRWSIPGDYAVVEGDGRITLLGRGSVSINSGGEKIFPEEVEGALKSLVTRLFQGSSEALLLHLIEREELSPTQVQKIQEQLRKVSGKEKP